MAVSAFKKSIVTAPGTHDSINGFRLTFAEIKERLLSRRATCTPNLLRAVILMH